MVSEDFVQDPPDEEEKSMKRMYDLFIHVQYYYISQMYMHLEYNIIYWYYTLYFTDFMEYTYPFDNNHNHQLFESQLLNFEQTKLLFII